MLADSIPSYESHLLWDGHITVAASASHAVRLRHGCKKISVLTFSFLNIKLKWTCNQQKMIHSGRITAAANKLKCLTLPEVPWTCPLVGYDTWGLPHSRTPWQSTGGPVVRETGNRGEALGEKNVQHHYLAHKYCKVPQKLWNDTTFLRFYSLTAL